MYVGRRLVLLSCGAIYISGQIIFCCRRLSCLLYAGSAASLASTPRCQLPSTFPSCDSAECLHTVPDVPLRTDGAEEEGVGQRWV